MKSVFVDSSGFFALLVAEDQFHQHACTLFQQANTERWRLVTTNVGIIEAYALFLIRSQHGRRDAIKFFDMLAADKYRIGSSESAKLTKNALLP